MVMGKVMGMRKGLGKETGKERKREISLIPKKEKIGGESVYMCMH
jgi:hypothetical protein